MNDIYKTPQGELEVRPMGHAGVFFHINDLNIYIDPYSETTDYSDMPKADILLITHEHYDHLDKIAVECILTEKTKVVSTEVVADMMNVDVILSNGDKTEIDGIEITAVPAYNIKHYNARGQHYHPKGRGNGYVLSFGGFNVYVAGDTEIIPEIKSLSGRVDVAFLPLCVPFTMSAQMWGDAVREIKPKVAYPYHYTEVDVTSLQKVLPYVEIKA